MLYPTETGGHCKYCLCHCHCFGWQGQRWHSPQAVCATVGDAVASRTAGWPPWLSRVSSRWDCFKTPWERICEPCVSSFQPRAFSGTFPCSQRAQSLVQPQNPRFWHGRNPLDHGMLELGSGTTWQWHPGKT